MSASLCPASNCSIRLLTLAAMISLAVCRCCGCLGFSLMGGNGTGGVHGCFLLGFWLLHFRVETRHVHAERHLAKAGVASVKGSGYLPPVAGRRARLYRVIFAQQKLWGNPLTRAWAEPLARFGFLIRAHQAHKTCRSAFAGRNRPARDGWRRTRPRSKTGRKLPPSECECS